MNSNKLAAYLCNDAQKINQRIKLSTFHGKKILITGAPGIIGDFLIATLSNTTDRGIKVSHKNSLMMRLKYDFQ